MTLFSQKNKRSWKNHALRGDNYAQCFLIFKLMCNIYVFIYIVFFSRTFNCYNL